MYNIPIEKIVRVVAELCRKSIDQAKIFVMHYLDASCSNSFHFWESLIKESLLETASTFNDKKFSSNTLAVGAELFIAEGFAHSGAKISNSVEKALMTLCEQRKT